MVAETGRAQPEVHVAVSVEFDAVVIRINGLMHLYLIRSKLLGIQSWIRQPTAQFFIEYTLTGGTVICDYDSHEKWQAILSQLESVL